MPDRLDFVAVVRQESERFADLARAVSHDAVLGHLPGWTVAELIAHLGSDYRWATAVITTRDAAAAGGLGLLDERGTALLDEFDRLGPPMIAALEYASAHPDEPCPNFAERDAGRLGFWPRRQAHETTMHRWDLEVPTGRHAPIDPMLATDALDESFHIYTRRYAGQQLSERLTMRCLGTDGAWEFTPAGPPGRVEVLRRDHHLAADIEGPPDGLLLAVAHRLDPDEAGLRFHDKETAARAFLAGGLTA